MIAGGSDPPRWRKIVGVLMLLPGAPVVVFGFHGFCAHVIKRIFVTALFGEAAYGSGVRMMVKQSVFTNSHLTPSWCEIPFVLLMLPDVLVLYLLLLAASRVAGADFLSRE